MAATDQIRHDSTRRNDDEGFFPVAALGGPEGALVVAPDVQADMIRLQRAARRERQGFYCPPALGGCGEELVATAGEIRRPYFRHFPGSSCGFRGEDRDIFTHRHIQRELVPLAEPVRASPPRPNATSPGWRPPPPGRSRSG